MKSYQLKIELSDESLLPDVLRIVGSYAGKPATGCGAGWNVSRWPDVSIMVYDDGRIQRNTYPDNADTIVEVIGSWSLVEVF